MLKNMNKTKKSNLITYAMVIVAYLCEADFEQYRKYFQSDDRTSCSALYLYYPGSFSEPVVGILGDLALAMQDLCV